MWWIVLGLAVLVLAILASWLATAQRHAAKVDSYRAKKPLSEPEQTLYWRLRDAVPECVVLSQVSFSRFVEPHDVPRATRQALFNRIAQKSVDYLICLPDFTVVAAVELDDGTHKAAKDAQRDAILASANLPLVRVHVRDMPSVDQLRGMFTR